MAESRRFRLILKLMHEVEVSNQLENYRTKSGSIIANYGIWIYRLYRKSARDLLYDTPPRGEG